LRRSFGVIRQTTPSPRGVCCSEQRGRYTQGQVEEQAEAAAPCVHLGLRLGAQSYLSRAPKQPFI
jgi:hypothetical protein